MSRIPGGAFETSASNRSVRVMLVDGRAVVREGLRAVIEPQTYLQPSLGVDLARLHRARDASVELLPLEEQVLRLLALGHTNTEVARLCNMSLRSAESYRAQVQRKLGRRTRAELVAYARAHGLIELGSPPTD